VCVNTNPDGLASRIAPLLTVSAWVRAINTWHLGISNKAGKGIRTLDIQLGKLTLYQLSYARITVVSLSIQPDASLHNPGPSRQISARSRDTRPGLM
jgi:hypothetical protein